MGMNLGHEKGARTVLVVFGSHSALLLKQSHHPSTCVMFSGCEQMFDKHNTSQQGSLPSCVGSIDDFLSTYKHDQFSILDFLSSLDEISCSSSSHASAAVLTEYSAKTNRNHDSSSMMAGCRPTSGAYNGPDANECSASRITPCEITLATNVTYKRARSCASAEELEAQRKCKNREYQRRFRERRRKMLQQRLSGTTDAGNRA
jgi:hypothetical protein